MNVETMGGWSNANAANRGFVRSAMILAGATSVIALVLGLVAVATNQTGSGGPRGVAVAAAICLLGGWTAEGVASLVHRAGSPLNALLAGMALRLFPPLLVCTFLAMQGGGRQHLAFIVYLLTFYFMALALDTWWAVQRAANTSFPSNQRSS